MCPIHETSDERFVTKHKNAFRITRAKVGAHERVQSTHYLLISDTGDGFAEPNHAARRVRWTHFLRTARFGARTINHEELTVSQSRKDARWCFIALTYNDQEQRWEDQQNPLCTEINKNCFQSETSSHCPYLPSPPNSAWLIWPKVMLSLLKYLQWASPIYRLFRHPF